MSDSEDEGGNHQITGEDKDQLMKIEENDKKVNKADKKRKRREARGLKDEDGDKDSELSDDPDSDSEEEKEEDAADAKKIIPDKEHAPLKKTDEQIKKAQFMGEKFGHYKIGCYMRISIKIDKSISRKIEPDYPVVLCSLKQHELNFAFVRVKIKKHRWFPHVLKTKDPIVFSVGWRKFQSVPVYTMEDETTNVNAESKMRMIKYTPKFGFSYAVFFAPTYAVGTTFVGF